MQTSGVWTVSMINASAIGPRWLLGSTASARGLKSTVVGPFVGFDRRRGGGQVGGDVQLLDCHH